MTRRVLSSAEWAARITKSTRKWAPTETENSAAKQALIGVLFFAFFVLTYTGCNM